MSVLSKSEYHTSPVDGLLQIALDKSASGIFIYEAIRDATGQIRTYRIVLINGRAETILGRNRAELLYKTVDDLFPESAGIDLWANFAQVIESGEPLRREMFYHIRRTGMAAWFDLLIEPVGDGQRLVVSFTDITKLRSASESLLSDSILLKALSSTVPEVGVVVTNFFKKVVLASGALPGLVTRKTPEELVGTLLEDSVLPEFRHEWRNHLGSALAGEANFFSDQWGGDRSEVYVGPVLNNEGHVVMILVVFRNVTEQYSQQQALLQSNAALQQSNQNLEQFAYIASHDLQEPLRKIQAFGDLLKTNYSPTLGTNGTDLINRMQAASDRMSVLIQSLLAYARLGADTKRTESVSLNELFATLLLDLGVLIQERNSLVSLQSIRLNVPGDQQQLRQLFQNLLTNALKFVPANRTPCITIRAGVVAANNVPNPPDPAAHYAQIVVKDNGIGIEEADYDKIFGLFNRLNARQQFQGSGIGLATTRKVVENHNGVISVKSEIGEGTEFYVYLPLGEMC